MAHSRQFDRTEGLLFKCYNSYKDEESKVKFLDRFRKSKAGRDSLTKAIIVITGKIELYTRTEIDNAKRQEQEAAKEHFQAALDRHELEMLTNTNLSIHSPTMRMK